METNENCSSFSFDESPSSKRQKLSNVDDLHGTYLETIIAQGKMIRELQNERNDIARRVDANKNMEEKLYKMRSIEAELRSKNTQLEAEIKDEKKSFAELQSAKNNQITEMEKQNETAQKKIKELEEQLLLAKDIKPVPECSEIEKEAFQDNINELQSACDNYAKKIKELETQLKHTQTELRIRNAQTEQVNNDQTNLLQSEIDSLKTSVEEKNKKIKDMEGIIESLKMNVAEIQFELEEMEKCYKNDFKKNKELTEQHVKEMQNMKAEMQVKIDADRKTYEAEIKRLDTTNGDLLKTISEEIKAAAHYQNQIDDFNTKITVAKTKEDELCLKIEKCKEKKYEARAKIVNREKQIQDLKNELKEALSKLDLSGDAIEYEDFMKLVSSRTITTFKDGYIKKRNGKMLGIDEILKELPDIEIFQFNFSENSEEECRKLAHLSTLSNLRQFTLTSINPSFDISVFTEFIKKYPDVIFVFQFRATMMTKEKNEIAKKEKELRKKIYSDYNNHDYKVTFEY